MDAALSFQCLQSVIIPVATPGILDGSKGINLNDDTITYGWTQIDGPMVMLNSNAAVSLTFTAPDSAATFTFILVVTDSLGTASMPDTVVITVTDERTVYPVAHSAKILTNADLLGTCPRPRFGACVSRRV